MASRERLRVALVSFDFGEYSVRLASALAQEAEVLLVLPRQEVEPHASKLNGNVRLFSFTKPRIRQVVRQFRTIRVILQRIRDFAPDVVHYQGIHLWFDLALPFLRRYPLALTIHDFRPHPGDQRFRQTPFWIEMFARRRADQLIVHSRHVRDLALGHLHGVAENVTIIPHIQIGQEPAADAHAKDVEEESLILFFGRIWKYKGLEYLIRAEPLISERVPDARILIAGRGEDLSRYREMMVHPGRFVVDNEYISDERAAGYFRRASVVVLPYLEASQSGVIPMAYSAGKPVVATTVGGLPEMVEQGRTGFLVAPRDVRQLAQAVTRLLLDAPLRRQMGANGRRKLEAECSPDVVAQKTIEVYRRAIERDVRSPRSLAALAHSSAGGRQARPRVKEHAYSRE